MKIMFNERYGLQQAVLERRKTMTRRILKCPKKFKGVEDVELEFHKRPDQDFYYDCVVVDGDDHELGQLSLPYEVGDVVAIAQSYHALNKSGYVAPEWCEHTCEDSAGYKNKMFVRADLMPHHIRITDLWFERLQDISDEDCLKEGITTITEGKREIGNGYGWDIHADALERDTFFTPRQAFAALIDKVSGKGTWEKNPWVVVYTFELVD